PVITAAQVSAVAKAGVIAGLLAVTLSGDDKQDNNNPYLMRLQYQEDRLYHYWSTPIYGKKADKNSFLPVTKQQVRTHLGIMFTALQTQNYTRKKNWDKYKLGADEPALWRAIVRMSIYIQTHGPTEPGFQQFHQEYIDPLNTKSPRID